MTVKELQELLKMADNDRIIAIERPDENRPDNRYLNPTGDTETDHTDEYFIIYTD